MELVESTAFAAVSCFSKRWALIRICWNILVPGAWLVCKSCDGVPYSLCTVCLYTSCGVKKIHRLNDFMRSRPLFWWLISVVDAWWRTSTLWNCVAHSNCLPLSSFCPLFLPPLFPSLPSSFVPPSFLPSSFLPSFFLSPSPSSSVPPSLSLCVLDRVWQVVQVQCRDQTVFPEKRYASSNLYYLVSGSVSIHFWSN